MYINDSHYTTMLDIVKHCEGYSDTAYICPAGYPSIGFGRRINQLGIITDTLTELRHLEAELLSMTAKVQERWQYLSDNKVMALTSLAYNIGWDRLIKSQLGKALDAKGGVLPIHFKCFRKANGKILRGLEIRRAKEWELWQAQR